MGHCAIVEEELPRIADAIEAIALSLRPEEEPEPKKGLQKRFYSHRISWKSLREIGIDLGKLYRNPTSPSGPPSKETQQRILGILQEHMPEMIRIKGYDVNCQPILTLDYFFAYLDSFMNRRFLKPSGSYLFTEQGYRVLVDEHDRPIESLKGTHL